MRRLLLGAVLGVAVYKLAVTNPLWYYLGRSPQSVPEWMLEDARRKGVL